jgi:HK97 gp10 family phage protein
MPDIGSLKIEGGKALERKLAALPGKVANKIVSKALRAGAKIILAESKIRAPKKSGLLARSLKVRSGKRRRGTARMVVQTKDGDYRGETFYGAFVYFGHRIGSRKLGDRRKVAKANPFLKDAFEHAKHRATAELTNVLRDEIVKAAKV